MPTPDPRPGRSRRSWWPAVVGLAVSILLLAWALRGVRLSAVVDQIRAAQVAPLLGAVVIATLTFAIRLVRWRLLLRAEAGTALPPGPLWHAIAVGFMANNVLPFRAGEVVRCYAVSRLAGVRMTAAISSVVVERLFDALTVVLLLTVALLGSDIPAGVQVGGVSVSRVAQIAGALSAIGLVVAALVVAQPLAAERIARRLIPSPRIADRVVALLEGIRHGLAALRTPALLAGVGFWSLALWTVNAAAFWVGLAAFDIPVGYLGALLLQGLLVFGISVPSTPGFVGPFEAVIVAALALYGVAGDRAFSYAIAYHLTTFVPITLLGIWSLARTPLALSDLRRRVAS